MFKLLNVGIIGCGSIARQRHAHEYSLNPQSSIAGFYDRSIDRARAMTEDFGGRVYESVEELITDPKIEAISVCAANKYHAELTISALNAGKHVLCEKPMAITFEDCKAMEEAARRNGKRLLIGHNQRITPTHIKAKELLDSGSLGRVISFQSVFGHKGPEMWSADKSANTWFFKKDEAFFGSMADLGIHKIDLMCYLIPGKVSRVYSSLATLHKTFPDGQPIEVDDNSVELLNFDSGAMGTIATSWTHYGEECQMTVLYCEKGIMKLYADPRYSLQVINSDGTKAHYEVDRIQTNDDTQQTSSGVIDLFVKAATTGEITPLDADQVLESMRVVFACMDSAQAGCALDI